MSCSLCTFPACPAVPCPSSDCGQNFCCQDHLDRWVGGSTSIYCMPQNAKFLLSRRCCLQNCWPILAKTSAAKIFCSEWVCNDMLQDLVEGQWTMEILTDNMLNLTKFKCKIYCSPSAFNGPYFLFLLLSGCQMIFAWWCRHRGRDDTCPPYLVHSDPLAGRWVNFISVHFCQKLSRISWIKVLFSYLFKIV